MAPHTVVFVDGDTRSEQKLASTEVPETVAYAQLDGVKVPIVRIVRNQDGQQVLVRSFDTAGRCLRSQTLLT